MAFLLLHNYTDFIFGLITINNIISKYNGNIDYSIHDQYLIADITILNVL